MQNSLEERETRFEPLDSLTWNKKEKDGNYFEFTTYFKRFVAEKQAEIMEIKCIPVKYWLDR